jgi:hypothetical protein
MRSELMQLAVIVDAGPDSDAEQVADLARQLRRQLLELDVEAADLKREGIAPPGTRAGEHAVAFGALLVTLAPTLLSSVVELIKAWAARPGRRARIEVGDEEWEIGGLSRADQHRLVQLLVDRHTK